MASGLFMAAYSFGTFLGPFVGGLINTIYAGPKS
jgi:MFS family permease